MKTIIYSKDDLRKQKVRDHIKKTLLHGKNVVFPTETVYGIGAYALSEEGVKGIYKVKGRPSDNPLIMHITDIKQLSLYVTKVLPYVTKLIEAFWPGPLTLVFPKSEIVPSIITGGLNTVAIRVPSNHIAREIINIAGVPICAPSANISGRPSSTKTAHVIKDFNGLVDIIVDGGKSEIGLESTVLDVTQDVPVILRPGMITKKMISDIVGEVRVSGEIKKDDVPKAPGMKYKHYAPSGNLTIVQGDNKKVVEYINEKLDLHKMNSERACVITTKEQSKLIDSEYKYIIGDENNELEIASNLFAALREMDDLNIQYIYSVSFNKGEYQEAIMNRLIKAANKNIVDL